MVNLPEPGGQSTRRIAWMTVSRICVHSGEGASMPLPRTPLDFHGFHGRILGEHSTNMLCPYAKKTEFRKHPFNFGEQ
jgi:hypothetical protein